MKFKIFQGLKNASYLAITNVLCAVIQFFAMIYIVRTLGPENYGTWVTIVAFIGIFGVFTFGGLHKVLIREGSKDVNRMNEVLEDIIGIRNLCILIAITICIIGSFFAPYSSQIKWYIIIYSSTLAIDSIKAFVGTIYQATENFKSLAILGIIDKLVYVTSVITILYLGYGLTGLVYSAIAANLLSVVLHYRISKRFVNFRFFSSLIIKKALLKQGITFSILNFLSGLATRIDLLMISLIGTVYEVGVYAVAHKLVSQLNMLRNVNSMAFMPMLVKKFNKGSMKGSSLVQSSLILAFLIFVVGILAHFFAEEIVISIFGSEYKESGKIIGVLAFYQVFFWASLPFTTALQSTHNEIILVYVNSVSAVINIVLNLVFYYRFGLIGIAYSTIVVYGIGMSSIIIWTYIRLKKQGHIF